MVIIFKHWPLFFFIAIYIIFSFLTFKDYGITLDEHRQYFWGEKMKEYFLHPTKYSNAIKSTYEVEEKDRRNTPLLSTYYRGYTALLSVLNPNSIYERYHFLNLAFAGLLILASYFLLYEKTKTPYLSLTGPLFIFLTPRFLGHIPANPKDMPFAVVYFLGLTSIYFSKYVKDDYLKIFYLGFFFFLAQSFRTIGFSIYIVYVAYLVLTKRLTKKNYPQVVGRLILVAVFSLFLTTITWPHLGANFVSNFKEIINESAHFDEWNKEIPFMGKMITPETRPWYYLFVYLVITAPLFIILNLITFLIKIKKDDLTIIFGTALIVNLFLYLLLNPVIYNGLRHFLFLLPIAAFFAALGFIEVFKIKKYRYYYLVLNVILLVFVLFQLVKLHPYEYIYFNPLFTNLKSNPQNYEIEYWGASYKEGVDWLLANVKKDSYKVATCNNSFAVEYFSRGKFELTGSFNNADYILCDEYRYNKNIPGSIVYQVERMGIPILKILKV